MVRRPWHLRRRTNIGCSPRRCCGFSSPSPRRERTFARCTRQRRWDCAVGTSVCHPGRTRRMTLAPHPPVPAGARIRTMCLQPDLRNRGATVSQGPNHKASTTNATTRWSTLATHCPLCWGQRMIWESSIIGLVPVVCRECAGTGRHDQGDAARQPVSDARD